VLLAAELHVACWWAGWTEALLPAVVEVRGALTRVECRVQGWVEAGGTGCRQYVMDMRVPEPVFSRCISCTWLWVHAKLSLPSWQVFSRWGVFLSCMCNQSVLHNLRWDSVYHQFVVCVAKKQPETRACIRGVQPEVTW
jgi:hypothetical protein